VADLKQLPPTVFTEQLITEQNVT